MEELWIEPKMIDLGNDEFNIVKESLNTEKEENVKDKNDMLGKDRKN